jgi:hypothetical protein
VAFSPTTRGGGGGGGFPPPPPAPRLRWSAPRFDRVGDELVRTTIRRLGKGCGAVVDALEASGGKMTKGDLASALGMSRARDLRRRYLERLQRTGVVECCGEVVSLVPDYLSALHQERVVSGEVAAEERDREKYAREREAYRNRDRVSLTYHHANIAGADGHIEDLERVGELSEADSRTLEAIEAFEGKYGRGSFRWDRASCKELFYSSPGGIWPESEELRRIRDYLTATRGEAA